MPLFRRRRVYADTDGVGSAAELAEGWNGLTWGSSLTAFRERFPKAHLTESGWWRTGEKPETFCGVEMAITQYAFNSRHELETVALIPEPEDRAGLSVAAVNELGAPDGMALRWTIGDVVVELKLSGVVATLTHPAYVDT
jgi:hypothetical protein